MKQVYYQDIDFKEGTFGMTKDGETFVIVTHKTENRYIAVYKSGDYDNMEELFFNKRIEYIETIPFCNCFSQFKRALEDSINNESTGISEVVYAKKRDKSTLEMIKKWRKEIEEEINKREGK